MNVAKKEIFEQRMQALHNKYCQQLPDKYEDIESSWNNYLNDLNKMDSIEEFYRLIHTLKGTAATFGFNTQADICFKIQTILVEKKESHISLGQDNILEIQVHLNELKRNISVPADEISE